MPPGQVAGQQAALTASDSSLAEYRKALEDSYSQIVARESRPVPGPQVDVEAAASIPVPQHRTINGALSYFTTDLKADIQTSLIRSAKYKPLIDKVLDDYKLPRGLAYLPVIESAYMPTLTSRAGAHGIWQIMPDTARELGLRIDWWVDERADPERSTRAAANYLRTLYRQFNDWPLALAAYNCGPGRIRPALNENNASTFWELLDAAAVPKETRGYVPTFFATLIIASDPATYGFRLGDSDWTDDARGVEVEGPLALKTIAEAADVEEALLREGDSLKRLARAIGTTAETLLSMNNLRSARDVGEGDAIFLPLRARELSSLLAHAHDNVFYAVRKGDTLYSIARKHKLSIAELRELNQFDRGHKLHPGEKVRVSPARVVTAGGM